MMSKIYKLNEPVWKRMGSSTDLATNAKELVQFADADYEVVKKPIYTKASTNIGIDTIDQEVKGHFATVRQDTNDVLGVVKSRYEVIQNRDAFSFIDSLVSDTTGVEFETCGVYDNGASIFVTLKLPQGMRIRNTDDVIQNYLVLTNSHDGSSSLRVLFTPVRVWCQNTLQFATRQAACKFTINHTKSAKDKITYLHYIMNNFRSALEQTNAIYNQLADFNISDQDAVKYIAKVMLNKDEYVVDNNRLLLTDVLSTKKKNKFRDVIEYTQSGIGQDLPTTKGTLWGLYNGITGYYQNVAYEDIASDHVKKFNSNLFGVNATNMEQSLYLANDIITHGVEILNEF